LQELSAPREWLARVFLAVAADVAAPLAVDAAVAVADVARAAAVRAVRAVLVVLAVAVEVVVSVVAVAAVAVVRVPVPITPVSMRRWQIRLCLATLTAMELLSPEKLPTE